MPLIDNNVHIFPCAKGFFIVKFESSSDRKIILHNSFSWQGRFTLMAKPWHMDFDPLSESFNKVPIWVRLPNLLIHLWQDSIFEAIGNALGVFLYVDSDTSDIFHSTCARFLVELDVSKGLPKAICLDSPRGSWTQMLDFEGIPFRCRNCHLTGHIAARCDAGKSKSRRPPTWWTGVSSKHYKVRQPLVDSVVSEAEFSPAVSEAEDSPDVSEADVSPVVLSEPAVAEGIPSFVSSPVPACPMGQLSAGSYREVASASVPSGSVSSEVWVAEAARLEDGWVAVKGKRSRPSAPPLDMNLRSRQGKFKSKAKS